MIIQLNTADTEIYIKGVGTNFTKKTNPNPIHYNEETSFKTTIKFDRSLAFFGTPISQRPRGFFSLTLRFFKTSNPSWDLLLWNLFDLKLKRLGNLILILQDEDLTSVEFGSYLPSH